MKNAAGIARANRIITPQSPAIIRSSRSGRRAAGFNVDSQVATAFEAASTRGLVPMVPDMGPEDSTRHTRTLQRLSRHLKRNSPYFQGLIRVMKDTYANVGPVPVSRHSELVDLWHRSADDFDGRGVHGFGSWLREDIADNLFTDGEVFARRETDDQAFDGIRVPLVYTAYPSDYVPIDQYFSPNITDDDVKAGIRFGRVGKRDLPTGYFFHTSHPRDHSLTAMARGDGLGFAEIAANEIHHLFFQTMTGGPRGLVILASALIRAIKLQTYEDAELRRKISATMMSLFIERPLGDMASEDLFPSDEMISELIAAVEMAPGAIHELPGGYKANLQTPPDSPGFDKGVQLGVLSICAGVGVPPYEVLGNYQDANERMARFAAVAMKTRAGIIRQDIETRLLNRMWRSFVDTALAFGLWTPGNPRALAEAYQVSWDWPVVQSAAITQEIGVMLKAQEAGEIPPGYVSQTYFGKRHETVTRESAERYARMDDLGLKAATDRWAPTTENAQRVQAWVSAEEGVELDLVEQAGLDSGNPRAV